MDTIIRMGEKEVRADAVIDVGILAVGLSKNPATDYCLEVIEDVVRGRIRALIPYTLVFGAHYILTRFYGVTPKEANKELKHLKNYIEKKLGRKITPRELGQYVQRKKPLP